MKNDVQHNEIAVGDLAKKDHALIFLGYNHDPRPRLVHSAGQSVSVCAADRWDVATPPAPDRLRRRRRDTQISPQFAGTLSIKKKKKKEYLSVVMNASAVFLCCIQYLQVIAETFQRSL